MIQRPVWQHSRNSVCRLFKSAGLFPRELVMVSFICSGKVRKDRGHMNVLIFLQRVNDFLYVLLFEPQPMHTRIDLDMDGTFYRSGETDETVKHLQAIHLRLEVMSQYRIKRFLSRI